MAALNINVDDLLKDAICGVCFTIYAEDQPDIKGARELRCGHTTCGGCLQRLLDNQAECPVCLVHLHGPITDYPIDRKLAMLGALLTALQDQSAKIANRDAEITRLKAALAGRDAEIAELTARPGTTTATVTAAAAAAVQEAPPPAASSPKAAAGSDKYERFADLRMRRGRVQVSVEWKDGKASPQMQSWKPLSDIPNGAALRALIRYVYARRPNVFKQCVRDELKGHGVDVKDLIGELKSYRGK